MVYSGIFQITSQTANVISQRYSFFFLFRFFVVYLTQVSHFRNTILLLFTACSESASPPLGGMDIGRGGGGNVKGPTGWAITSERETLYLTAGDCLLSKVEYLSLIFEFSAMTGIFDSGSGGLSVLREILRVLPEERFVYYADNANCPYGEKTPEFIQSRCRAITEYLLSRGARIIVVACNTATAAAITTLRNEYPVRFIGMEPAVKPAALSSKTGVIGILATAGTLKGIKYLTTKGIYEDDVKIVEHVGRGFVELVENGILDGPQAEETVRRSIQPLLDAGADRIVLGCTHYPFLRDVIQRVAGPDVQIIDPAPAVARHLIEVMREEGLLTGSVASTSSATEATKQRECSVAEPVGATSKPDIELVTSGDDISAKRILNMVLEEGRTRQGNQ